MTLPPLFCKLYKKTGILVSDCVPHRGEPGVITQVGLLLLSSGSPGSMLGQPKAETSLHCNSRFFRFSSTSRKEAKACHPSGLDGSTSVERLMCFLASAAASSSSHRSVMNSSARETWAVDCSGEITIALPRHCCAFSTSPSSRRRLPVISSALQIAGCKRSILGRLSF